MSTSAISAALPESPVAQTQAGNNKRAGETVSKDAFLQLLVAQIKNQDPLKPADGTQFLTQLAQFSELEQLIGIRDDLKSYQPAAPNADPKTAA
ncbi:MAG: hypothetical protein HY822_01505 [Acidobacteria bacterium]|nr:hypothetical protein [Acidobacteriota bacterium]